MEHYGISCNVIPECLDAFNPLITGGSLVKVQDELGNAIEQLPPPIGWIDNIHNLNSGEGYKVRTNMSTSLDINSSAKGEYPSVEPVVIQPSHFKLPYSGNGLDHMNIYLKNPAVGGVGLRTGDEIGVFDGGRCVGAVVVRTNNGISDGQKLLRMIRTHRKPMDLLKATVSGLDCGIISQDLREKANNMKIVKGYGDLFEKLGTSVLAAEFEVMSESILGDAYPNPSKDMTTFHFQPCRRNKSTPGGYQPYGDIFRILVTFFARRRTSRGKRGKKVWNVFRSSRSGPITRYEAAVSHKRVDGDPVYRSSLGNSSLTSC